MSGVAIVRYLLANNQPLLAQVPATRIMAGTIPLNSVLPAISISEISGTERLTLDMSAPKKFFTERVQVSALTKTYPLQKSILLLARAALPLSRGTVNGFAVDSVLPDVEGPDLYDDEFIVYMGSQDFLVSFNR